MVRKTYYYSYGGDDPYMHTYINRMYVDEREWWKVLEDILSNEVAAGLLDGVNISIKTVKKLPRTVREAVKEVPYEISHVLCINNRGAYTYIFIPKN